MRSVRCNDRPHGTALALRVTGTLRQRTVNLSQSWSLLRNGYPAHDLRSMELTIIGSVLVVLRLCIVVKTERVVLGGAPAPSKQKSEED